MSKNGRGRGDGLRGAGTPFKASRNEDGSVNHGESVKRQERVSKGDGFVQAMEAKRAERLNQSKELSKRMEEQSKQKGQSKTDKPNPDIER